MTTGQMSEMRKLRAEYNDAVRAVNDALKKSAQNQAELEKRFTRLQTVTKLLQAARNGIRGPRLN